MIANVNNTGGGGRIDPRPIAVLRLLGLCRNDGILCFQVVKHTSFDKIHSSRGRIIIDRRWENPWQISVNHFKWSLARGSINRGIDSEFDGGDKLDPIRTAAIDVVAQGLENRPISAFSL